LDFKGAIFFLHVRLALPTITEESKKQLCDLKCLSSRFSLSGFKNNEVPLLIGFRLLQRTAWDLARKVKKPKRKAKK